MKSNLANYNLKKFGSLVSSGGRLLKYDLVELAPFDLRFQGPQLWFGFLVEIFYCSANELTGNLVIGLK